MADRTTSQWLTACLHYAEPWEELLVKAVKPYTDIVLQTGVAERFFFQRSWDRGPNIRLWFKGNPFYMRDMLKPNLKEHFLQYFNSRPSYLIEPHYPEDFPEKYKWRTNNTIHFLSDGKSMDRFNGRPEMPYLERQFQASSVLALNMLQQKSAKWSYNELILSAVKLHLGLAHATGMNLEAASDFFNFLFRQWIHQRTRRAVDPATLKQLETSQTKSFARIFNLQKRDTISYHAAMWELLKNYRSMEDPGFIHWIHETSKTHIELGLAMEQGRLPERRMRHIAPAHARTSQQPLWPYYEEFVRLTNNRLGITSKDEGYIYYIMSQSLELLLNRFTEIADASI